MEQKNSLSFTIPQKQKINGKYQDLGSQVVNISNFNDIINIGRNLTESHTPICSIINKDNQLYLMVSKNFKQLQDLKIFSDAENENFNVYKLKNVTMFANEDISFSLSNPDAKSFGKIAIKSKGIIHEKSGVQTTLLSLENENLNVELPKNIVELTKNDAAPIQLRASKQAKRCALPAQMFDTLKEMEANGSQGIKVKEWANIGKKGQTLRIALYGDRILVGDGVELKEVYAGFKIVPDMNSNGEITGNKDLIVRFDKSSEKVGESKNSKLVDGLSPEIIKEITNFLPQEKNGEKIVEEETKTDIEKMQIESIKTLTKPGIKIGINALENVSPEPVIQSTEESNAFTPVATEPENVVVAEPTSEPAPEPAPEPTPEPVSQPETETKSEPVEEANQESVEQPKVEDKQDNKQDDKANDKANDKAKSKKDDGKEIPGWKLLLSGITAIIAFALCIATAILPGFPFAIPLFTGLIGAATAIPTISASGRYIKKRIDDKAAKKKAKKEKTEDKQTQKAEEKKTVKEKDTTKQQEKAEAKQEKAEKKAEIQKQNEERLLQEQVNQNFDTLLNNTEKNLSVLKEYNECWGKDAKTAEKQEFLNKSKAFASELEEFREKIVTSERSQENLDKINLMKQDIKSKYPNVLNTIKDIIHRSNIQEP